MNRPWQSVALLAVQLGCMAFVLLTGHLFAAHPWIWLEFAGIAVLAWAVVTMKPHRVTALPEPRADAQLVTRGPYRWVRHPMYAGVLLITLALVLDRLTIGRVMVWLVLLADLLWKLEYEEKLLAIRFPGYASYRQRSKRLLPGLY